MEETGVPPFWLGLSIVATLQIEQELAAPTTLTVSVTVFPVEPGATDPTFHVTVEPDYVQFAVHDAYVVPVGRVSLMTVFVAVALPVLPYVSVYVIWLPATTGVRGADLAIVRFRVDVIGISTESGGETVVPVCARAMFFRVPPASISACVTCGCQCRSSSR